MNRTSYIYIIFILFTTILKLDFSYGQSSLGTVCAETRELYGVTGFDDSEFIWSVEGGVVVNGDGEDTVNVQWGYQTGTYRMEVVEITSANCTGVPSIATVTVQAPEVDLLYDFFEICDEDSMVFDASGDYDEPYLVEWHDGSTETTFTAKKTELVWVRIVDNLSCVRYDSVDFTVHPLPVVYIGEDTVLCDVQNTLSLTAVDSTGNSYAQYEWYSSTMDAVISMNPVLDVGPGQDSIILTVTDYNGCAEEDTIIIYACDVSEMFRDMVNTFTPNDDGVNDVWNITEFMHLFPDAVLEVFDRWGRLVYRTENVAGEPWDGTSKGREMPMDSYFFVLELNYMNLEALSGTVNLIR